MKKLLIFILAVMMACVFLAPVCAFAETGTEPAADSGAAAEDELITNTQAEGKVKTTKAWAATVVIAVVAAAGAIGMALSIMKTADSMARQPEAAGDIRTSMMLGLVFIETAIIYALIIAILIIFVL